MSAATVSFTAGRAGVLTDLSAIYVTVTLSATAYATATGGVPFDLYSQLAVAGPIDAPIKATDIRGFLPDGLSSTCFMLDDFTVGTVTSSTVPCTIRMYGSGENAQDAFVEIDDADLTGTFSGWVLVDRGGAN